MIPVRVPHPDNMDDEIFRKHMNARHADSLGGLTELTPTSARVIVIYRAFHRRLHDVRVGLQHEHKPYEKTV